MRDYAGELIRVFNDSSLNEVEKLKALRKIRKNKARAERDEVLRSCGLTKVRGNLGGTYWE